MTEIASPTPEDDIVDRQERYEAIIDERLDAKRLTHQRVQSAQVVWAPTSLAPASNAFVGIHVAGTPSANGPVSTLLRTTSNLTAFRPVYTGTEFTWEILEDGVYVLEEELLGLAGNATDGNVQLYHAFSDITSPTLYGNTISGSGKQPIAGMASAGLAAVNARSVFIPAPCIVTPRLRLQFSGTPTSPPSISTLASRVTKIA